MEVELTGMLGLELARLQPDDNVAAEPIAELDVLAPPLLGRAAA